MKHIFVIAVLLAVASNSQAQLKLLYYSKSFVDSNHALIYPQYNFRFTIYNGNYVLKAIQNDTMLFDPMADCIFETFQKKFIIISVLDTSYHTDILNTISRLDVPRNIGYIIPVNSLFIFPEIYTVDFERRTINEDIKNYNKDLHGFKIKKIDLTLKNLQIYDNVTGVVIDLCLTKKSQ